MSNILHIDRGPSSIPCGADNRFRAIFDAVNDGIFISDPASGRFIEVNEPACRMFGYTRSELIGQDVDTLSSGVHPHTRDMAIELNRKALLGEPQIFEWQCRNKNGHLFWTEFSLRYAEFADAPAMVGIVRDIAERKRLNAEIVYMAHHDVLTGLANRSMFTAALEQAIAQSLRAGKRFAVLYLDLDQFKDVNDTRGHLIGDRLLRLVAERLQAGIRVNELVARFGGDEFAILLGVQHEPEEVAALARRLIVTLGMPFPLDGNDVHVGVSIGVSMYGADAEDAETLLSHADIALYRAKAEGRQTFRFFSPAMNTEVRSRVTLTNELRLAIPNGEIFLVYQPQVRVRDGRIIGVEALVRWHHPTRGVLMPECFLPVAEGSGLIAPLSEWVLREACRQGRLWLDAGTMLGPISVNLASAQFKAPLELENMVLTILRVTGLPPDLLDLEITESTLINISSENGEMIQRMREAGIRFSLDDFGTGYSSLNYLRRFSIDRIKIAHEFISELATSAEAASIVKLILGLSRSFGKEVIAEGVETPEQFNLLQDWDCQNVQGFFFGGPVSAEAIGPILKAGRITSSKPTVPIETTCPDLMEYNHR
jgi:diguanylate cyclase (GGDEF)-like protein/PAS domain S-box-containing protein